MKSGLIERFLKQTEFDSYEDFRENFEIVVPPGFNFGYDVVDEYARIEPDKVALVWCDDNGSDATFTFSDLKRLSDKTANFLRSAGVCKGDAVMLMLKRRYEWWITMVALHKIGAIAVPASHLLTSRDIIHRNNAADVKMIIAANDERLLAAVDESREHSPSLELSVVVGGQRKGWYDFDAEVESASQELVRPVGVEATCNDDILLLFFTSGTTGAPKMVQHDHTYPLGHILTAKYWQNVQDNGLHLTVADTGWAKACWGKIYGQWIAGSAVFVYDYENKFDACRMLEIIDKYRITTFCGPATVYRMMVKENCEKYDLSSLKYCVVAGEPLYPEVFYKVLDGMGLRLMEGFGQSETTVAIANYPWMEPKPGSMGKPSPNYDVDLVDDDGLPVGVNEHGHVVFRTDRGKPVGMLCCYYRSPELTDATWHDGLYYTGDIAWRDEDGYYWYVGRADDTIKSSGYKIAPFEVESVLHEHPAVAECAVTGVPDDLRGQLIKATIVLHEGYEAGDAMVMNIQEHVKSLTAPYKYPRVIEFVSELPRTTSGKVKRAEIKRRDVMGVGG